MEESPIPLAALEQRPVLFRKLSRPPLVTACDNCKCGLGQATAPFCLLLALRRLSNRRPWRSFRQGLILLKASLPDDVPAADSSQPPQEEEKASWPMLADTSSSSSPLKLLQPALVASVVSFLIYPSLAYGVASLLDPVARDVIKGDVSQFMQNFFNFNSLLFSFFISQTYASLYQQQESLYLALFSEVAQARSLIEQLSLISQSRPSYRSMLKSMSDYLEELIRGVRLGCPPAVLVAAKPANDPLENILYLTSVGVPSAVYDTVRSLRQARGTRLGATQRKLPREHFVLLTVLGALELLVFPLLGAGISGYETSDAASPGHVLWIQSFVFACLAGGVVLALQVIQDLRSPTSGLYSLEEALDEMVQGLQEELDQRLKSAPVLEPRKDDRDVQLPDPFGASYEKGRSSKQKGWASLTPKGEEDGLAQRLYFCGAVGLVAAILFIPVVSLMQMSFSQPALQAIREDNNAQWLQNCFTGVGLIFSLFAAQTFGFLYSQQEAIYLALYAEVSEAKALLEQLALVCRGRPSYSEALLGLRSYVSDDLRRLDCPPAQLLAGASLRGQGVADPLERVLYLTSVGVPSSVYETVKGLRQARGDRLGATQRKLPEMHFALLAALSVAELLVFPVLAAGCAALDSPGSAALPGHISFFQASLFGLMAGALTLTFLVLYDLWTPLGETYSMKNILAEMVSGLEEELDARLSVAEETHSKRKSKHIPQSEGHAAS
eukprot:TRINITY_DN33335_c0_g1_i1.p1 TRINITY_DN33335_c0_g1~~TRINITY_DN33335_c0_g1_i1.p1  ORF type:complete len:724 (-),score=123.36 TRINITY_DN33335_c0_g1_i1:9-2180(-)